MNKREKFKNFYDVADYRGIDFITSSGYSKDMPDKKSKELFEKADKLLKEGTEVFEELKEYFATKGKVEQ